MKANLLKSTEISYFSSIYSKKKSNDISLDGLIEEIKSDKFKGPILQIRNSVDKDKKNLLKSKLSAVTISCNVSDGRKTNDVISHSGIIQMDFDNLPLEKVAHFKSLLKNDKYSFVLFDSPSGFPKVIVQIPKDINKHKDYFKGLSSYYKDNYSLKVDEACKDITRLMYLSYDPDIYVNQETEIFNNIHVQEENENHKKGADIKTRKEAELIIQAIEDNRIDITKEYKNWLDVIFSLIEIFGNDADSFIHRVSRFYPKYLFEKTQTQIDLCKSSEGSGITKNTFFHIAKKYGVEIIKGEVIIKKQEFKNRMDKFSLAEKYLNEMYDIRYNTVRNDLEIKSKDTQKYNVLNENNLYVELIKKGITMAMNSLLALLKSDFVKKYDPIESYFKNLPEWDGQDYISDLCTYIGVKEQLQFNYHFKKWIVRLIATAIEPQYFNKQMLVFVSQIQNNGKSTLSRFFCPPELRDYLAENISLDKDSRILLAKCILINMDELATFSKEDINSLKALQSKDQINERLPYDRKNTVLPRRCSFIGSTNQIEFLKDETGSARWLCFEIVSIDWKYSNKIDINKVYSQAYSLYKSGNFNYDMTYDDIQENERRNKQFYMSTIEKELIEKYFEADLIKNPSNFYQATDVLGKLQDFEKRKFSLNNVKIGKALTASGFERLKFKDKYGYFLKLK